MEHSSCRLLRPALQTYLLFFFWLLADKPQQRRLVDGLPDTIGECRLNANVKQAGNCPKRGRFNSHGPHEVNTAGECLELVKDNDVDVALLYPNTLCTRQTHGLSSTTTFTTTGNSLYLIVTAHGLRSDHRRASSLKESLSRRSLQRGYLVQILPLLLPSRTLQLLAARTCPTARPPHPARRRTLPSKGRPLRNSRRRLPHLLPHLTLLSRLPLRQRRNLTMLIKTVLRLTAL